MATSNVFGGQIIARGGFASKYTVAALADAGVLLTPAQVLGGLLTITPTADRTLQLPTAAALRLALPAEFSAGDGVVFTVVNNAAAGASTGAIISVNTNVTDGTVNAAQLTVEGYQAFVAGPPIVTASEGTGEFLLLCTAAGTYVPSTNTYTGAAFTVYRIG